jgi:iron complex transport system ATP-binding protein
VSLIVEDLTFAYGPDSVLDGIDLELDSAVTALIGPNAVGKSTLLRCVAGILQPQGRVEFDGHDLSTLRRRERAQLIGYLGQDRPRRVELTVLEAVLLGRLQTLSWRVSDPDLSMALAVLQELDIADLALGKVSELSAGQKQIVSIAQVLVQRPRILLMDEPTNSLDLQHQLEITASIVSATRERGLTTIVALHDLNLAARVADTIVVLHEGRVYASGSPDSVLTADVLRIVYGVEARVRIDEEGLPIITPLHSIRAGGSADRASWQTSPSLTSEAAVQEKSSTDSVGLEQSALS